MPRIIFQKPMNPRLRRVPLQPGRTLRASPRARAGAAAIAARLAKLSGVVAEPTHPLPEPNSLQVRPNPYVDYARHYTREGGIVITYKDVDDGAWVLIRRILMWLAAMIAAGLYVIYLSPLAPVGKGIALFVTGVINALIVSKSVELYRHIEVRPDCMIIDGIDVFWRDYLEGGWPSFRRDAEGRSVLCGIYGTRWVEFFSVRRFDENDRAPEVFAAHLQAAMAQQWTPLGRSSG